MLLAAACTASADPGPAAPTAARTPSASATNSASPTPSDPTTLTVAFVQAVGDEDAADRVVPALEAATLAFSNAEVVGGLPVAVEVAAFDTGGSAEGVAIVAAEIATTPEVVAAIGAPGLPEQAALGDALDAAGVPWISLSGSGAGLGDRDWMGWRRLVVDQQVQGQVLAATIDGLEEAEDGVCLVGDGSAPARSILGAVRGALDAEVVLRALMTDEPASAAETALEVTESRCGAVAWGGEGSGGAALRRQLTEDGLGDIAFVGGDRIQDDGYLAAVGSVGEGTLATCPCVDVTTSTDLAAQRFIQDYQSEFGSPPGPYAVEAWDAARILVAAMRAGARTREEVRASLAAVSTFDGLAVEYRFDPGGDLLRPAAAIRLSELEGGRWVEIAPSSSAA